MRARTQRGPNGTRNSTRSSTQRCAQRGAAGASPRPRERARSPDLPAARSLSLAALGTSVPPAGSLRMALQSLRASLTSDSSARRPRTRLLAYSFFPSRAAELFTPALASSLLVLCAQFVVTRPSLLARGGAEFCSQRCGAFISAP
jgi:hypothetical protein